ncbi:MAG: phosphoadenylyl-sulfate reductase [Actinomycetota bacterium]|nr:phosphoadenylyl-sulfate reductase [Actinomycetota bacterium]
MHDLLDESRSLILDAIANYSDLTITTGLNVGGTVLIDLAAKLNFTGEVVFVDTGYHFPETISFYSELSKRYGNIEFVSLSAQTPYEDGFLEDPAKCCEINKVEPLFNYLEEKAPSALLNGRTRDSARTRSNLSPFEEGTPLKINPLYKWTTRSLIDYSREESLSNHPLVSQGYLSMGCWPCTRAVAEGDDPRSGRFVGQGRVECGIWTRKTEGSIR